MLCENCKKLSIINAKKSCIRCQNSIMINIAVLCDFCSLTEKQCAACLKKIVSIQNKTKGCGCGRK